MRDKLGMSELILDNHDVETVTKFDGTVPLPRLLHQQIHACIEARMSLLDSSVLRGLQAQYTGFRKARAEASAEKGSEHALSMYLTTWLYLSVLEELEWDAWRWNDLLDVSTSFDGYVQAERQTN